MNVAEKALTIAENMQKVYEAGKNAEYAFFWNAYQNNGQATDYSNAFQSERWNDVLYKPMYDIVSNTSLMSSVFQYAAITDTLVTIDARLSSGLNYTFYSAEKLKNIRKLIVSENTVFTNTFNYTRELVEIRFEGTIANSLDIHWSTKLSAESYESILSCLSDTSVGMTLKLPSAAEAVYDTKHGIGTWAERTKTYSNWIFQYA